jgi:hypothetical protein
MRQLGTVGFFCGLCLACGGDGGGYSSPTGPPSPPPPPASIVGTFSAPDFWSATETPNGSNSYSTFCAGSVTVAAQSGGTWTGSFTAPGCRVTSGTVSGTVDSGGNVVLRFDGQTPFGQLDCDVLTSALDNSHTELRGTFVGGQASLRGVDSGVCGTPLASTTIDIRAQGSSAGT